MSLLQFVLNVILAILAFFLVERILAFLGVFGALNTILSLLAAIGTFFANFAGRIIRR